ncbi:MAG TPA: ATP-binding cassette domain-containing protein [Acetobacteraceae bacterium]
MDGSQHPRAPRSGGARVRNLTRRFGGSLPVLDQLDLDIAMGEFMALLGASGSGKTTLLRTLAGLDPAQDDAVVDFPHPAAVAPQQPLLLPWKTVWRNVALGLPGPDALTRAEAALADAVHRAGLLHRSVDVSPPWDRPFDLGDV